MSKKFHCLYAGLEGCNILCMMPGMECVDADCSGYDSCGEYKEGSRIIDENIDFPRKPAEFMTFKEGKTIRIKPVNDTFFLKHFIKERSHNVEE